MAEALLQPALPWDILREIAFICPRETCSTLMHTCTFLYHEAAASILSHEIILLYEYTVVAFLKFLHAGKKPRYRCVRDLRLGFYRHYPPLSPDNAKRLADAITLMTRLGVVVMNFGEYTIRDWPVIGDAIASLPSLRQIIIKEAGPLSWHLLSLQSNLESIKLNISERESEHATWLFPHPVQLFRRWKSTLTDLVFYGDYTHPVHDVSPCYPDVYPMMHTLSMSHRGRMDPIPYIRAFPNLAHLRVHCTSRINNSVHEDRTSNARSQREVEHLGPASQRPGWRELIQFNGTLVDLYALALNCHIAHIRLHDYTDDKDLPLLSTVLADARPIHLNIYGFEGILHHPTDSLSAVLHTQGASHLESLVVSCLIYGYTPHEDVVSALFSLAASLAMLPGPFRRLQIGIELDDDFPDTHQPPSSRLTIAVAQLDVEQIVQHFVETIPTLEDVLIRYRGGVVQREDRFERGGAVTRIGGTWVTDDPLKCSMFELE